MKSSPSILNYMSPTRHSIEADQPCAKAAELMKLHAIQSLPVLKQGQIQGILNDRDLSLALSIVGDSASSKPVVEIARKDLFLVRPDARLDEVVRKMAALKIGTVLIVDQHQLVGIFTATDAMRALNEIFNSLGGRNSGSKESC